MSSRPSDTSKARPVDQEAARALRVQMRRPPSSKEWSHHETLFGTQTRGQLVPLYLASLS